MYTITLMNQQRRLKKVRVCKDSTILQTINTLNQKDNRSELDYFICGNEILCKLEPWQRYNHQRLIVKSNELQNALAIPAISNKVFKEEQASVFLDYMLDEYEDEFDNQIKSKKHLILAALELIDSKNTKSMDISHVRLSIETLAEYIINNEFTTVDEIKRYNLY